MTPEQLEQLVQASERLVTQIQLTAYRTDGEFIPSNVRHAALTLGRLLEEVRWREQNSAGPAET
jgi:hypothetical protein